MQPNKVISQVGSMRKETYTVNGDFHRVDGPAVKMVRKNGVPYFEQWFRNGVLHREDGPAQSYFDEEGRRYKVQYCWNGALLQMQDDRQFRDWVAHQIISEIHAE